MIFYSFHVSMLKSFAFFLSVYLLKIYIRILDLYLIWIHLSSLNEWMCVLVKFYVLLNIWILFVYFNFFASITNRLTNACSNNLKFMLVYCVIVYATFIWTIQWWTSFIFTCFAKDVWKFFVISLYVHVCDWSPS